jgi:hypothetical protein
MPKHYIAAGGIHGCMPAFCSSFDEYDDAVNYIVEIHELGKKRKRALKRDGSIELNMRRDGNEYADITECNCDTPQDHDDS